MPIKTVAHSRNQWKNKDGRGLSGTTKKCVRHIPKQIVADQALDTTMLKDLAEGK
jgi:hypothetical protein